jgi:diguanylate cyclase (GGDEF)-like protein
MASQPEVKILIAEDDPHTRHLLREVCESLGHTTLLAEDGEQALLQAANGPDLALLDVMMPKLDGFEVLRRLRASPQTRDVSVIVLTALEDIDAKLRGIELGADDYVTKPFRIADLQRRIAALLDKRRYRDQLRLSQRSERCEESSDRASAYPELKDGLEHAVTLAWESARPLSALFISVDGYPLAFEGLGSQEAGKLLAEVSHRLELTLREADCFYRIDVESFVVLMPETTCEAAATVGERLQKLVRDTPVPAHGPKALSVSMGIAGFPRYGAEKPEDLIRAAKRAMQAAHGLGSGRISIA